MSSFTSLNAAFALALASQGDSLVLPRLETPVSASLTTASVATLLATLDPTRAAFASALQRIDVANAPQVAGPYVPGAAAGPLTENDIFDPSELYSLPGQALVVFDEAIATGGRASVVASALTGPDNASQPRAWTNAGAPVVGAFDIDVTRSAAAVMRSAADIAPVSKLPADIAATHLDPGQPALTPELAVAGYMSLLTAGLSPTRRKIIRKLKIRESSWDADQPPLDAEERDRIEADRKEDGFAVF